MGVAVAILGFGAVVALLAYAFAAGPTGAERAEDMPQGYGPDGRPR